MFARCYRKGCVIAHLCLLKVLFSFGVCWVFADVLGLSLVAANRGYPLVVVHRLLTVVASLVAEPGSRAQVQG